MSCDFQVGCTPLHRAASTGKSELCEFLIEEGAEIDATDKMGQTPLMHAVICDDKQVIFNLIYLKAASSLKAEVSKIFGYLCDSMDQVAFMLVRHGADVDVEDKEGYTVLGRASSSFRPALIEAAKTMLEG